MAHRCRRCEHPRLQSGFLGQDVQQRPTRRHPIAGASSHRADDAVPRRENSGGTFATNPMLLHGEIMQSITNSGTIRLQNQDQTVAALFLTRERRSDHRARTLLLGNGDGQSSDVVDQAKHVGSRQSTPLGQPPSIGQPTFGDAQAIAMQSDLLLEAGKLLLAQFVFSFQPRQVVLVLGLKQTVLRLQHRTLLLHFLKQLRVYREPSLQTLRRG